MKKVILILAMLLGLTFVSCDGCSGDTKEAGDQAGEAMDEVRSDLKKVGEGAVQTAKKVGEDMKQAGEQVMDSLEKAGKETGENVRKVFKDSTPEKP